MKQVMLLLGLGLVLAGALCGAEVKTTVKYIAADAVYIDAGKTQGVQVGDRVVINRKNKLLAVLEVIFVSNQSSSCRLLESTGTIEVGDEVVVQVAEAVETPADSLHAAGPDTAITSERREKRSVKENRWTGRIGAEFYAEDDRESTNNDFVQPSVNLNTSLLNIGGSAYTFSLYMRARRNDRSRHTAYATESHWNNRLYEAALTYDDPAANWGFSAGRVARNAIAGIGTIDGLLLSRNVAPHWSVGAFGGTQPNLENTDIQTDEVKAGAFAQYKTPRSAKHVYSGTLAVAGDYRSGEINREFVYQQAQYRHGSRFYVYESSEFNLNRGWQKHAAGSTFTWTSFLMNARWSPTRTVSCDLGYDNRRSFRTWTTRSLVDSLFDDATRQGLRAGVQLRLARTFHAGINGNLRARKSDFSAGRSVALNAGSSNIAGSGLFAEARLTAYDNDYSKGTQPSARLQRTLTRMLSAHTDAGIDHYEIKAVGTTLDANWLRLGVDARFTRHWYASAYGEARRGAKADSNQMMFDLGYRF